MNEIDILKIIAENLSERKSVAALNNYLVLSNNIKFLNDLFKITLERFSAIHQSIVENLGKSESLQTAFNDTSKANFYFKKIIPRVIENDINMCSKFLYYTEPDNRIGITIENVSKLSKDFIDYSNLVTSTRQYIDSFVSDVYQILRLEAKELNYHVLTSLNSFKKFATKSISEGLFNDNINDALSEFEKISFNKRKNSQITECKSQNFADKVDFILNELKVPNVLGDKIKDLFRFSSEFTHIGYVSTFFATSKGSEVIFSDEVSPYLPSTENFNELKYEVLETAFDFFAKVYLPAVIQFSQNVFTADCFAVLKSELEELVKFILAAVNSRNSEYYSFITAKYIKSNEIIPLQCRCGNMTFWEPPHDENHHYCKSCGSRFTFLVLEGDPGYIMTSDGPVKVLGSSVPEFSELPENEKIKILQNFQKQMDKSKKSKS